VLFTDIPNSRIMRYDPATGDCAEYRSGTNEGNGLMFDRDGALFCCEGGGRRVCRYEADGTSTAVADSFDGRRLNSPNDLAFDGEGRLWFTDPRYTDEVSDLQLMHQSIYRMDPESDGSWRIARATFDTTKPNGLLVSADLKWLYVAQSHYGIDRCRELRRYPIHPNGAVGPYDVLHNFYPHRGIDGMCLDREGNIVATAGWRRSGPGPMIYVFDANGRVLSTHPFPVDTPTNCTFGDSDLSTLYVTGGACLFRARTEHVGYLIYPR
jgi:gluconolactonase